MDLHLDVPPISVAQTHVAQQCVGSPKSGLESGLGARFLSPGQKPSCFPAYNTNVWPSPAHLRPLSWTDLAGMNSLAFWFNGISSGFWRLVHVCVPFKGALWHFCDTSEPAQGACNGPKSTQDCTLTLTKPKLLGIMPKVYLGRERKKKAANLHNCFTSDESSIPLC